MKSLHLRGVVAAQIIIGDIQSLNPNRARLASLTEQTPDGSESSESKARITALCADLE